MTRHVRPARCLAWALILMLAGASLSLGAAPAARSRTRLGQLGEVAFDQNLNAQIPLDARFHDERGHNVTLGSYFGKKPVILTLNYYTCPMLCTVELNGLLRSLMPLSFDLGKDFEIVTVSINPAERPPMAAAKKASYIERYGRPGAAEGWHFLTGDESSIKRVADAAGFRYAYDKPTQQYAHPAGIMILTPQGKIARYFYGVDYPPRDIRLGLIDASAGKIGSPVDQLLLMCYHYDPRTGRYNAAVSRLLQVCGIATVLGLGSYIGVMLWRDQQRRKPLDEPGAGPA